MFAPALDVLRNKTASGLGLLTHMGAGAALGGALGHFGAEDLAGRHEDLARAQAEDPLSPGPLRWIDAVHQPRLDHEWYDPALNQARQVGSDAVNAYPLFPGLSNASDSTYTTIGGALAGAGVGAVGHGVGALRDRQHGV